MTLTTRQQVAPAIRELLRRRRIAATSARKRKARKKLLREIGKLKTSELRAILAGTAEALLREIAEKDGAAIQKLLDVGIEVPRETIEFCNRSRAFLKMELITTNAV